MRTKRKGGGGQGVRQCLLGGEKRETYRKGTQRAQRAYFIIIVYFFISATFFVADSHLLLLFSSPGPVPCKMFCILHCSVM